MWLNDFEFDVNLNSILTAFEATFSYHSIMAFFSNFRDFRDFRVFAIGLKMKTQKSRKIFIFWIYKAQMDVSLFFDHYFNFLSVKTKTKKNGLSLIKPHSQKIFKPKHLLVHWQVGRIILSLMFFQQHCNCF